MIYAACKYLACNSSRLSCFSVFADLSFICRSRPSLLACGVKADLPSSKVSDDKRDGRQSQPSGREEWRKRGIDSGTNVDCALSGALQPQTKRALPRAGRSTNRNASAPLSISSSARSLAERSGTAGSVGADNVNPGRRKESETQFRSVFLERSRRAETPQHARLLARSLARSPKKRRVRTARAAVSARLVRRSGVIS